MVIDKVISQNRQITGCCLIAGIIIVVLRVIIALKRNRRRTAGIEPLGIRHAQLLSLGIHPIQESIWIIVR